MVDIFFFLFYDLPTCHHHAENLTRRLGRRYRADGRVTAVSWEMKMRQRQDPRTARRRYPAERTGHRPSTTNWCQREREREREIRMRRNRRLPAAGSVGYRRARIRRHFRLSYIPVSVILLGNEALTAQQGVPSRLWPLVEIQTSCFCFTFAKVIFICLLM